MRRQTRIIGDHQQRASRLRVGYKPLSTHDRLAELVGAACDVWLLKNGWKWKCGFYFGSKRK